MSSNSNHINSIITLDNYEEYFILYLDNELQGNQVQMVESFLQQHPHLQIELDMLKETKLPVEEISFDKTSLFSVSMPTATAEDELLLFIDNELDPARKKIIQLELQSNSDYEQQYQQLLRTELNPSEIIVHPNKKELYRQETRVIGFGLWMRIAAALILIAGMTVLYLLSGNNETLPPDSVAINPDQEQLNKPQPAENRKKEVAPVTELAENNSEETAIEKNKPAEIKFQGSALANTPRKTANEKEEFVAVRNEDNTQESFSTGATAMHRTSSIGTNKQSFNNRLVTVDHADPYNNITASIQPAAYVENAASNNDHKKGSLKTFFRKATRIVGQTTGFNASNNDDGEVLIGAVAVKL